MSQVLVRVHHSAQHPLGEVRGARESWTAFADFAAVLAVVTDGVGKAVAECFGEVRQRDLPRRGRSALREQLVLAHAESGHDMESGP
jgi:hypothetical protein